MKRFSAAALIALCLAACQSVPPVPENKYYRLQAPSGVSATRPLLTSEVIVLPLQADGLYSERAMLFSSDGARQLQQYHYHHWLYPPAQVVQEFLAKEWQSLSLASRVQASDRTGDAPYFISGRIVHFERLVGQNKARIELELRLEKKGKRLWQQTYRAEEAMSENSLPAYVVATENALKRISNDFLTHLRSTRLE